MDLYITKIQEHSRVDLCQGMRRLQVLSQLDDWRSSSVANGEPFAVMVLHRPMPAFSAVLQLVLQLCCDMALLEVTDWSKIKDALWLLSYSACV